MRRTQSRSSIVTPHIPIYPSNKNISRPPGNNDYTNKKNIYIYIYIFFARIERLGCVNFIPLVFAIIQITALKVYCVGLFLYCEGII